MVRRNNDIRWLCKSADIPLWRLAEEMGIGDATLYRHLNRELTEAQRQEFFAAINRIVAARQLTTPTIGLEA